MKEKKCDLCEKTKEIQLYVILDENEFVIFGYEKNDCISLCNLCAEIYFNYIRKSKIHY